MFHQNHAECGGERMLVAVRRWRVSSGAYFSRRADIDSRKSLFGWGAELIERRLIHVRFDAHFRLESGTDGGL
jgi:hypothetical protein